MSLPPVDIAIIGAGPAGSCLAGALAQRGHSVALIEGDRFPRDKVCGEFLSGESMDVIDQLQWRQAFEQLGATTMTTSRLTAPGGREITVDLPRPARGLSRRTLDAFLFDQACQDGVFGLQGRPVKAVDVLPDGRKQLRLAADSSANPAGPDLLQADVVVAAYGRRTTLDRQLQRPFFAHRSPWVGFKGHHRPVDPQGAHDLRGVVELHAFDGGYCGASFVEGGHVNICTLFRADLLGPDGPADSRAPFDFLRAQHTPLGRRLQGLQPTFDRPLSVAQVPLGLKDPSPQPLLFVGDAASMIAPLAGDGQAMAMEGALMLAHFIDRRFPQVPHDQWQTLWRRHYGRRIQLGKFINAALTRRHLANAGITLLDYFPPLASQLVSLTRG